MKKTEKRIVLEASEGITFRVLEEEDKIVVRAILENAFSNYSDNYKNPFIPEGYVHLTGTWDKGFVIQNKADESEFVWIPVGYLDPDGTLDGRHFDEKFGRMNWSGFDFSKRGYYEKVDNNFFESVKKYGGFYISRYHASENGKKATFKKGKKPWVDIEYRDAEKVAANYAKDSKDVVSIITSGASFDSMLRWIIKSGEKKYEEVADDSTSWGNYSKKRNSPGEVLPTGSKEKYCVCNIYDIAGNVNEWTSEKENGHFHRVLRGGDCDNVWPASSRANYYSRCSFKYPTTSFRAVIYKK